VDKERKYHQSGYQKEESEKPRERERPQRDKNLPREFRSPRMPAFQEVSRCWSCGGILPPKDLEVTFSSHCPNCFAELHVCKNCVHFDTSSRFECRQELRARVPRKDKNNECPHFELRRTVERQTGSAPAEKPTSSEDAREAFERLFRKI
jgi:predicted RNA-binding Zn-ribbon protein involved in translation (DUF1610 family)